MYAAPEVALMVGSILCIGKLQYNGIIIKKKKNTYYSEAYYTLELLVLKYWISRKHIIKYMTFPTTALASKCKHNYKATFLN